MHGKHLQRLQNNIFKGVQYETLHKEGVTQNNICADTIDIIADVAKQHESNLLWHNHKAGLIPCGATTIVVDRHGNITPSAMRHGRSRSKKCLTKRGVPWSKVCCSEHLQTALHGHLDDDGIHKWEIVNSTNVKGVAGELIELEGNVHGNVFFSNPSNEQLRMHACRHCGAYLFKDETSFCCNKGKNILPNHHFSFWLQPHCTEDMPEQAKMYFGQCNGKLMQQHPRLCNNSLSFTMLKHDSIHGTAHELNPEYYPWMVSIQGRTYHTYLNTPQPYNNSEKPDKRLNNNIGW